MPENTRARNMRQIDDYIAYGRRKYGAGVDEQITSETLDDIGKRAREQYAQQRAITKAKTRAQYTGSTTNRIRQLFQRANKEQLTTILPEPLEYRTQIIPEPLEIPLEKVANQDTIAVRKEPPQPKQQTQKIIRPNYERIQTALERRRRQKLTNIQRVGETVAGGVKSVGEQAKIRTAGWPTLPGGATLPFILLVLLVMLLLPVNGNTRLQWLWKVITGSAIVNKNAVSTTSTPTQGEISLSPGMGGGPTSSGNVITPQSVSEYSYSYFSSDSEMDEF